MSLDRKISQVQLWDCVRPCYIGWTGTSVVTSFICSVTPPGPVKSVFIFIAIAALGAALGVMYLASKIDREHFEVIKESEDCH